MHEDAIENALIIHGLDLQFLQVLTTRPVINLIYTVIYELTLPLGQDRFKK
jgi:hypothetical protein